MLFRSNIDEVIIENKEEEIKENDDEKNEKIKPKQNREKVDVIMDIIQNITPPEQEKIDIKINNLMKSGDEKINTSTIKKVLIFAHFNETLNKLKNILDEHNINVIKLEGTYNNIHTIMEKFNNSKTSIVLLINSIKNCSGLNLQTATDIIFTHSFNDKNIESQVCGRGHRIGRHNSLNIHFMLYENEYDILLNKFHN